MVLSTLPFLAVVISLHPTNALISLLFFGCGMLTPSLLFVGLGKASIKVFTKWGHAMEMLNKTMNWVLCGAGFYVIFSIYTLSVLDVVLASAVFLLEIGFLLRLYRSSSRLVQIASLAFVVLLLSAFAGTSS